MNLYRTSLEQPFLPVVADFIINNFSNSIDSIKVVLPNGLACLNLQKILTIKAGVTILPNIVPFADIAAESEEVFKIPSENIDILSYLEEKIILAEIIYNYQKLNGGLEFNLNQSLKFSSRLAKLFYEFTSNRILIDAIKDLPTINQAEHWQFIYQFLNYANQEWQKEISLSKKLDKATHRINSLSAEVVRIKQTHSNHLIIAGIFGHDAISWNFLKDIAELSSGYIILPPLGDLSNLLANNQLAEENPLYSLKQLLKMLGKDLVDFKLLGNVGKQGSVLDNLINHELSSPSDLKFSGRIEYSEFANIFEEAEAISLICKQNLGRKIAIILNNRKNKEFYRTFLVKHAIEFQDLLGCDLLKTNIINLIIAAGEVVCNDFNLKKLFVLLKNPLINSDHITKLEQLLLGRNRFISSYEELLKLLEGATDPPLLEWGKKIANLLSRAKVPNNTSFNNILTTSITIVEKLCPSVWLDKRGGEASELFAEIIKLNWNFKLELVEDFPEILKSIIVGASYIESDNNAANVIICKPEDAWLMKFDLIILANVSEGSWPALPAVNPWLNKQMQQTLALHSQQIRFGLSLYYFYLLLHNDQVIITRSKKQGGNDELLPSSYMLKLQLILGEIKAINYGIIPSQTVISNIEDITSPSDGSSNNRVWNSTSTVKCPFFPNRLSVSDIEMLMRNPYSFYAKKILGLRKQESIAASPKLSEFGTFVHNAIEAYTKSYDQIAQDKAKRLIDIGFGILSRELLPVATKKIWQTKFMTIAEEFIAFDEQRRTNCKLVCSELAGEMLLNIAGQEIIITAKADRIEIDNENKAVIMDYKTGSVPSKKEVMTGLSPQLIIEALIALEGGFKTEVRGVKNLIYVKIASSKPYIQITEIEVTSEELKQHQQGLKELLEYYVTHKQFSLDIDLLKYNDYKHLARRL